MFSTEKKVRLCVFQLTSISASESSDICSGSLSSSIVFIKSDFDDILSILTTILIN